MSTKDRTINTAGAVTSCCYLPYVFYPISFVPHWRASSGCSYKTQGH